MKQLLIIGGGFAGVWAALSAAETRDDMSASNIEITLISDRPELCVRPRLHEGAKPEMLVALEPLLQEINVLFQVMPVTAIRQGAVQCEGNAFEFDRLILAAGSALADVNIPGAKAYTFNADTYEARLRLDEHLSNLNNNSDGANVYVVLGAGFTGLEIITHLRNRLGEDARLILIDQHDQPGHSLGLSVQAYIIDALERLNVERIMSACVQSVSPDGIDVSMHPFIHSQTVILSTGLIANSLTKEVIAQRDSSGRIMVDKMLRAPQQSEIFVAGDAAIASADTVHDTLMSCQHAMPMGIIAGKNAVCDLLGRPLQPFERPFYATCLSLGPKDAVFTQGWDRQISKTGLDASKVKNDINENWIYPPQPSLGREKIFEWVRKSSV